MLWTDFMAIEKIMEREWTCGRIPMAVLTGTTYFPLRIPLKMPKSEDIPLYMSELRMWIQSLQGLESAGFSLEWKDLNHRQIGKNQLPCAVIVPDLRCALAFIHKTEHAHKMQTLYTCIVETYPKLANYLQKKPFRLLDHYDSWPRFLDIIQWLLEHPKPSVFIRNVSISGVHSKFIEQNKEVITELLDILLPPHAIYSECKGSQNFAARYGFLCKSPSVRFRFCDPVSQSALNCVNIHGIAVPQELSIPASDFAKMVWQGERIFICENEINFLSFPAIPDAMVIFGSGFGFPFTHDFPVLHAHQLYYWGDIDTHGFAILNQFRQYYHHCVSLLMNEETLMAHQQFWQTEPQQALRQLTQLTNHEQDLYQKLCKNVITPQLRLEQEHLDWNYVVNTIARVLE